MINFIEVDYTKETGKEKLNVFYDTIYVSCFPNENERETKENLLTYLVKSTKSTKYKYHILLMVQDSVVIGGAIFDYFPNINSGVIEFIAIKPNIQVNGFGTKLFSQVVKVIDQDSQFYKFDKADYVFCEIDKPTKQNLNKPYLHFWMKHNFKHIDFTYLQPALSADKEYVSDLWLIVNKDTKIESELVKTFLWDYMKYAMSVKKPQENEIYKQMEVELDNKTFCTLLKILEN